MQKKTLPKYHPSYTEEENKAVQEYLEQAPPESLTESIWELCQLYPEEERKKVSEAIDRFCKRIAERHDMRQIQQKLQKCRDTWVKYRNDLEVYPQIEKIRAAYADYKKAPGKIPKGSSLFDCFMGKYGQTLCVGFADDTVRKFLISPTKPSGIKRPSKPRTFYQNIDEIPIQPMAKEEAFQSLGKGNLESLLLLLLGCLDSPEDKNPAHLLVSFLNIRYSHESHKAAPGSFSSKLPEYLELKKDCQRLLAELEALREETEQSEKILNKMAFL